MVLRSESTLESAPTIGTIVSLLGGRCAVLLEVAAAARFTTIPPAGDMSDGQLLTRWRRSSLEGIQRRPDFATTR